jgi:hypothetical protein
MGTSSSSGKRAEHHAVPFRLMPIGLLDGSQIRHSRSPAETVFGTLQNSTVRQQAGKPPTEVYSQNDTYAGQQRREQGRGALCLSEMGAILVAQRFHQVDQPMSVLACCNQGH